MRAGCWWTAIIRRTGSIQPFCLYPILATLRLRWVTSRKAWRIEEQASRIKHLVAFGGDHGITLPLLRALAKRQGALGLIHLDALGQTFAHGTVFYHAIL
jgi:arginase family enzyme